MKEHHYKNHVVFNFTFYLLIKLVTNELFAKETPNFPHKNNIDYRDNIHDSNNEYQNKRKFSRKDSWFNIDNLSKVLDNKEFETISCTDILKYYLCSCDFAKSRKTEIIEKALNYIDTSLNEENFALNNFKDRILRSVIIDEDKNELFRMPSINMHNEKTCNMFFEEVIKPLKDIHELEDPNVTLRRLLDLDPRDGTTTTLLKLFLMSNL